MTGWAGVLATSTAVDPCDGQAVLSLVDQTIDANTGLVAASRDPAGVETTFTYDGQSRITSERPESRARTFYEYQLPTETETNLANQVTILGCPSTSATACTAADSLTWQRLGYDGLGRQVTEKIRIPEVTGIVEKTKTTTYNALGLKTAESVWGSSTLVTTFGDYDPFGRGNSVEVCGPAIDIAAASWESPFDPLAVHIGDGTSFSTPQVSGVATLCLAIWPTMTRAGFLDVLKVSSVDLGPPGWDPEFGWGRIHAHRAVLECESVFSDGFETGDTSQWSSSSP